MNIKAILEAANVDWNQSLNSANANALAALYAENATLSPGNGNTVHGRADIQILFQGFVDAGVHHHTLEIVEFGGSNNIIFQVAKWNAQGAASDGITPSFGGITTSVFELSSEGKWLVRTHIWNVNQ